MKMIMIKRNVYEELCNQILKKKEIINKEKSNINVQRLMLKNVYEKECKGVIQ